MGWCDDSRSKKYKQEITFLSNSRIVNGILICSLSSLENMSFGIKDSTIKIEGKLFILFLVKKILFFSSTKKVTNKFCFSASFMHKSRFS